MQLTINQKDIFKAIEDHIRSIINVEDDERVDITLKATRGDDGATAIINIVDQDAPLPEKKAVGNKPKAAKATDGTAPATGARRGRPPKAKPLEIAEKIEEAKATPEPEATITQTSDTEELPVETVSETAVENVASEEVEKTEVAAEAPRASLFAKLDKPKN